MGGGGGGGKGLGGGRRCLDGKEERRLEKKLNSEMAELMECSKE